MNPMHQLTRRPVKAAFGALLLALAGVILALSGGQFWAAWVPMRPLKPPISSL